MSATSSRQPAPLVSKVPANLHLSQMPPQVSRRLRPRPGRTQEPASQPNSSTGKQKAKTKASPKPATKKQKAVRFKRNWHLPRILHSIAYNSEHFLKRHNKPETRNQLEAASLKSAWHHIAKSANDPDFEPVLLDNDELHTAMDSYEYLCVEHDEMYTITPAKAEAEFKKLSSKLRHALSMFRTSGMGDCPWKDCDLDEGDNPADI